MSSKPTIAIIGAGPAGAAAAIQLHRFGYTVLLFEKNKVGGLIHNASLIENYIGFPNGINGKGYAELIEKHLERFNIQVINEDILKVEYFDGIFKIYSSKNYYRSDFCIVASGTEPIKLMELEIDEAAQQNIFYEISELNGISDKKVGIVGAGDAAFDYAISLSNSNKIEILSRSENIKALKELVEKVRTINNISHIVNISLTKINMKNGKLCLICSQEKTLIEKEFDLLIIAIGRQATKPEISLDAEQSGKLFLIGDVASKKNIRQTSIATGSGIEVAMKIHLIIGWDNESNC